eukprot:ANDGO_05436.mRNA.1 hypothetical protein
MAVRQPLPSSLELRARSLLERQLTEKIKSITTDDGEIRSSIRVQSHRGIQKQQPAQPLYYVAPSQPAEYENPMHIHGFVDPYAPNVVMALKSSSHRDVLQESLARSSSLSASRASARPLSGGFSIGKHAALRSETPGNLSARSQISGGAEQISRSRLGSYDDQSTRQTFTGSTRKTVQAPAPVSAIAHSAPVEVPKLNLRSLSSLSGDYEPLESLPASGASSRCGSATSSRRPLSGRPLSARAMQNNSILSAQSMQQQTQRFVPLRAPILSARSVRLPAFLSKAELLRKLDT